MQISLTTQTAADRFRTAQAAMSALKITAATEELRRVCREFDDAAHAFAVQALLDLDRAEH